MLKYWLACGDNSLELLQAVFLGISIRELQQRRRDGNRRTAKSSRFRLAKQQLGTNIRSFCAFLCRRGTTLPSQVFLIIIIELHMNFKVLLLLTLIVVHIDGLVSTSASMQRTQQIKTTKANIRNATIDPILRKQDYRIRIMVLKLKLSANRSRVVIGFRC